MLQLLSLRRPALRRSLLLSYLQEAVVGGDTVGLGIRRTFTPPPLDCRLHRPRPLLVRLQRANEVRTQVSGTRRKHNLRFLPRSTETPRWLPEPFISRAFVASRACWIKNNMQGQRATVTDREPSRLAAATNAKRRSESQQTGHPQPRRSQRGLLQVEWVDAPGKRSQRLLPSNQTRPRRVQIHVIAHRLEAAITSRSSHRPHPGCPKTAAARNHPGRWVRGGPRDSSRDKSLPDIGL